MMTPDELEEYHQAFPHDDELNDVGDYDDELMSDCCHPGHPSNYGDN